MTGKLSIVFGLFLALGIFAPVSMAQTTGFTYQGSLNSSGVVANGNHDFEFALFDAVSGGAQLGSTITRGGVAVTNGIFAVSLDFGNQFPGASRFLEIRVQPSGGGGFTTLTPRLPLASTPYSIKTLNADNASQLGSVAASQYVQTGDPRLSDARPPTVGSSNYIQNSVLQQAGSSFNVDGDGVIGGNLGVGIASTAGNRLDVNGASLFRTGGSGGGFISLHAPNSETGLTINGNGTTRADLRFDGSTLKLVATGVGIPPATNGIVIDTQGKVGIGTAFPAVALEVGGLVRSARSGVATQYINLNGGDSGSIKLTAQSGAGAEKSLFIQNLSGQITPGVNNSIQFQTGTTASPFTRMTIDKDGHVGIGSTDFTAKLNVYGTNVNGESCGAARIGFGSPIGSVSCSVALGVTTDNAGASALIAGSNQITGTVFSVSGLGVVCAANISCASDARLKKDVQPLAYGLSEVLKLRPVAWQWKDPKMTQPTLGLVAQDVQPILPELIIHGVDTQDSLGLNYIGLIPVLIKSIQEQQDQIGLQQKQIGLLIKAICSKDPKLELCLNN